MKRLSLLCSAFLSVAVLQAAPVGSAFTYQGHLKDQGAAATGVYDFQFTLYNDSATETAVGGPLNRTSVPVSNGLFSVTLDFGAAVFNGDARWLDIAVRTNGPSSFAALAPRQPLTPTPYAISAQSLSGPLPASNFAGIYTNRVTLNNPGNVIYGTGAAITDVNAATLGGLNSSSFWQLNGNAGTSPGTHFVGTRDNQPLEIKVNNQRALRIEPGLSANMIAGASANYVSNFVGGATIAGGGHPTSPNRVAGYYGVIGGGYDNFVDRDFGVIGGGQANRASYTAVVGGGVANRATTNYSTVPGGYLNAAQGLYSLAAGKYAQALHEGSFVWSDSGTTFFPSTASNQFSIRATGGVRLDNNTSMHFGNQMRQMLNLWNTEYGIGIQSSSLYFRSSSQGADDGFIWYRGGTHANGYADPGGGVELMHLVNSGLYVKGAFISSSDRNAKQGIKEISPSTVLEKVASLPVSEWSYKHDPETRHIGPMAQDFYAAFAVGPDDKHIATVDADGVALAAIQGLNQKLQQKDVEIQELKKALTELKAEVKNLSSKTR
ncbi:MAG TPA: tail fiber domain-containing protein [Verrucomicrobiae bacterium]|nr:tail fiber domain-containing protein [Verrucomicrobiae bacterium]